MSDALEVRASTTVAVPPEEAFALFTRDVDRWWRRGPRFRPGGNRESTLRIEPEKGGRFVEEYADGGEPFVFGRVLAWEPPSQLVLQLGGRDFEADEWTEAAIRFEAVPAGTRVSVVHTGFDTLPADHAALHGLAAPAFTAMMGLWWADVLQAARTHAARRSAA